MKETTTFAFFTFVSPLLLFPNLPITSPNYEQHNFENKKLENDILEG
jgi:hypothetical protein